MRSSIGQPRAPPDLNSLPEDRQQGHDALPWYSAGIEQRRRSSGVNPPGCRQGEELIPQIYCGFARQLASSKSSTNETC